MPDPDKFGTEYNGDYSFDGAKTITFKDMTLQSAGADYLGFIRADQTVVEDCIINGKTFYWGYTSASFKNTTFNCPSGDYAIWTYSSPTMTFNTCTFNSSGKVINVYTDYGAGKQDIMVNFENCTVNNTGKSLKPVLNINDSNMGNFKYILNISGNTTVTGVDADKDTCSRLFGFGGKAASNNKGKTVVSFGDTTVWEDGKMVDAKAYHTDGVTVDGVTYDNRVDGANDSLYAEGYKDNAFTITYSEWTKNPDGTKTHTVTKTCNYCGYQESTTETAEADPIDWDVSKSKIATKLDTNTWTSNVTLSLPSTEENLASDVVFVLDGSSSANTGVVNASLALLQNLKESASDSSAAVNVCVVKFKRQAYKSDWFDLSRDFDAIKTAMETKYSGGTNLHAGLLAGQEALEEHSNVAAGRKYLILVSDGSTYLYSKDGNWASDTPFTRSYFPAEPYNAFAGGYWDNSYYEPNNHPDVNVPRPKTTSDVATWQAYLKDVEERNAESHGDDYDYHCDYDLNFNQGKPSSDFKSQPCVPRSANNRDMAFYYADQVWQEIKNAGYNAYSIATEDGMAGAGNADDSHCFMNYLNGGEILNFSDIQQEILYAVGAGSTVEDKIGDAFDFVPGSLKLTVGGTELESKAEGNVTYFGDRAENLNEENFRFKVQYAPDTETFVWTINENVSNFAPVQLTYTVKLTNPETAPGTYGVEDLNGEKTLSEEEAEKALFTNAYAVLNAKNSAGAPVKAQEFPKPSVSYTVKSFIDASGSPAIIAAACLNTKDHYSYLIGYSDGTVRPNGRITRAEVATIFFRLLTDDARQRNWSSENNFSDVSADKWYNNAVSTLCHMGVLGGYSDGTFRPNAPITRAEFAKIAVSFSQANGSAVYSYFTDVKTTDWFAPYVTTAKDSGLIEGYSDGSFKPENRITRAEACAIVNRVLGRKPSKSHMKISGRIDWPDCTTADWFYEAIMEATNSHTYQMGKRVETWNGKLEKIFANKAETVAVEYDVPLDNHKYTGSPVIRVAKPKVFIPVFPGTNCEIDTKRAFEKAGAETEILVVQNLCAKDIEYTIDRMEKAIRSSQIIMIPGGFSGGDEPEGSGKFIATTFRNPKIAQAVTDLLDTRDGLVLGICNGFQALIKLGLVTYGKIVDLKDDDPTLTFNTLGRHVSRMVYTRVTNTKSPWLSGVNAGDVFAIPVSHGEGRFVADDAALKKLIENGQIATQYTTPCGKVSGDITWNPNGSVCGIEGITSPDGRVFGKMGHSERKGENLYFNVPGEKDQQIFESGVRYFK
mgnify:CR=1 FL=1